MVYDVEIKTYLVKILIIIICIVSVYEMHISEICEYI